MASSINHRVMAATVVCSTSNSSAAADSRPAGLLAMPASSLRVQSASLSSSHSSFTPCKLLGRGVCSPSGRQQTLSRQRSAVCMVLPTGTPVKEGQATGLHGHAKWSSRAIKSFSMAELEARKLKYPTTGTEALLMGMLTEGTSHASRFLRRNGVTLFAVRDETIKLLGKADMYFFSPEHPPLTEQAQKSLDWAIAERNKDGGDVEVTTSYMLLGIWAQKGFAGQKVLEALGFDDKKAEELLATENQPVAVS
ncbi:unnamed protein product [Calypogeia fissa]